MIQSTVGNWVDGGVNLFYRIKASDFVNADFEKTKPNHLSPKILEMSHLNYLKPFIKDLIKYYYEDLGNGTGGNLHVVLDDGNIDLISLCREQCEIEKDSFGVFLCDVLSKFTEDELEDMYEKDWWGMDRRTK